MHLALKFFKWMCIVLSLNVFIFLGLGFLLFFSFEWECHDIHLVDTNLCHSVDQNSSRAELNSSSTFYLRVGSNITFVETKAFTKGGSGE